MELRPYQTESIAAFFGWVKAHKRGSPLVVLPTGAGKSVVLAEIARKVCQVRPGNRVLVLAAQKELIEQNADKMRKIWPEGRIGVYSAGLGEKSTRSQVTFAGIQSLFRKPEAIGPQTLILVDEAQHVPPGDGGMYNKFFAGQQALNTKLRIAGVTATPYRTSSGLLTSDGGVFTDICYDAKILDLVRQGYLAPLVSKLAASSTRTDGVKTVRGDFDIEALIELFDQEKLVRAAAKELVEHGRDRKSWLCFCVSVAHAEKLAEALRELGVRAASVSSETESAERDRILQDFKSGTLQAVTNCQLLITGFDHPGIDLIGCLRATKSVGLWQQMLGRGLRICEGKTDTKVLDFTDNSLRLGPIDQVEIRRKRGPTGREEFEVSTAPCKECPSCRAVLAIKAVTCPDCGYQYPAKHDAVASTLRVMSDAALPPGHWTGTVSRIDYLFHTKKNTGSQSVRCDVHLSESSGFRAKSFSFWKSFEGKGRPFGASWWASWHPEGKASVPSNAREAAARAIELRTPEAIVFNKRKSDNPAKPFYEISSVKSWKIAAVDLAEETGLNI